MRLECPLVLNLNPRLEAMSTMTLTSLITAVKSAMAIMMGHVHSCKKDRNQVGGKKDGHEVCIPRGTARPCKGHATAMPGL